MRILCDLHHSDLYYSLQLLFEKRLGAEMYRPIGLEWYHEGYWNVFPHIDTARQYLSLDQAINPPRDTHGNVLSGREVLNASYVFEDGIYYVDDTTKKVVQRAITLEKFKNMEFDIIIASMPEHLGRFRKLRDLYQPRAKVIFQIGNHGWQSISTENILASTTSLSTGSNHCLYHQEFDLSVFKYEPPKTSTAVYSHIHYMRELDLLARYKSSLPSWTFKTFGAGMEDCHHLTSDEAQSYVDSGWTWHVKSGGDGYGYAPHRSYACGRPLIVRGNYYRGQLAEQLFQDGINCIDLDKHSFLDNITLLQHFSHPEEHARLCENAYNRFREVVDFDAEEQTIRKFLERLV